MAPNRDLCFPVSDCSRSTRVCPKWRPNSYNECPKGAWGQREKERETPNLILVLNWPKQTILVSAFFHSSQGRLLACSQLLYAYKYTHWSRLCHWHSKIALSTTTLPFNLFSLSHTQSCYDLSLSLSLSLFPRSLALRDQRRPNCALGIVSSGENEKKNRERNKSSILSPLDDGTKDEILARQFPLCTHSCKPFSFASVFFFLPLSCLRPFWIAQR